MATELGKAYVQIMPSARGISGSIQKTLKPEATAAGKSAGKNIADAMAKSLNKTGKNLTKYITTPVVGAATAVAGLVGALGWGRLTGLDAARAKLQGLGYDMQSVDRISEQVRDTIQGTVITMAEGTSVAAGALAAGVKEGEELQRYIKLVGDAAVGANRPINDMAMIFNRVQGMGRLMTQELNMIEDGMPGFAMAMSKSLGVTQEEFRKMVTAGQVSSEQFLDVMEDFAGEMSEAYANSWAGMVSNTKANIGIIGENILGGVFEQSKEAIAEFLTFLRSDDLRSWARETGKVVGEAFENLIRSVKDIIKWWIDLDSDTKKVILGIVGIAVAIGPTLMFISKLITAAKIVSSVIAAVASPVGLVITAIVGLIAVFVALYRNNEKFRDLVQNVWEKIKDTITTVIQVISDVVKNVWGVLTKWWSDNGEAILQKASEIWNFIYETVSTIISEIVGFVMDIWGQLVTWWQENSQMILQAAQNVWNVISTVISTVMSVIWGIMQAIWPVVKALVVGTWEAIKGAIQGAINVITGIIQFFAALFTGNWSALWDSVKQIVTGAVQLVWNLVQLWFVGKILKLGKALFTGLRGIVTSIWNTVKSIFTSGVNTARNVVSSGFNFIRSIISSVMNAIRSVISSIWNGIRSTISSVVNGIRNTISRIFNSLRGIVSGAFNGVRSAVSNGMTSAFNTVKNFFGRFKDAGKRIVTSIADGIKGAIGKVTDAIGNVTQKVRNFLPFSPPKEGPLIDIMDVKWGETISAGILKSEGEIASAMERALDFDLTKKATFNVNSNSMPHYTTQQQPQPIILQIDGKTFAKITGDYTAAEGGNRIRRIERGLAT